MSHSTLNELIQRLPELEWKLSHCNLQTIAKSIPPGLFASPSSPTPAEFFIQEIKENLQKLNQAQGKASQLYLATKIKKQINTLVYLCKLPQKVKNTEAPVLAGLQRMESRRQWIENQENKIAKLTEQHSVMQHNLLKYKDPEVILNRRKALGEIERQLTLAQETLSKALQGGI